MSTSSKYGPQIRRLFNALRRGAGKVSLEPTEDPMTQLLLGVLGTYASDARAEATLTRLRSAVVDLNELRVTPVSEIVEMIGVDIPSCRLAAEELSRCLNSVFNHLHSLDLTFLKTAARKTAEAFLNSLDGVGGHAKASVILRCLNGHVVPVDAHMHLYLQKAGCIPPSATVHEAQRLLTNQVKDRDAATFYVLLKRHAATHAPRKTVAKKPVGVGEATKVVGGPAAAQMSGKPDRMPKPAAGHGSEQTHPVSPKQDKPGKTPSPKGRARGPQAAKGVTAKRRAKRAS